MQLVKNKLQVRHYPQVPYQPFCVDVKDEFEAKKILDTLAKQHLWLYENRIIPDYCNVIEVVMLDEEDGNSDWISYWNEKEQMDWDEFEQTYLENTDELAEN